MPILQIFTTLTRAQIPVSLGQKCAKLLSETMRNKPVNRICVHIAPEQIIYSGAKNATNEPSAFACLNSIGSVTADDNRKIVAAITTLLQTELLIPKDEIRIVFQDMKPEMVGMGGLIVPDFH